MKTIAVERRLRHVKSDALRAVYATADGSIFELPGLGAAVDGGLLERADPEDFIPMPEGTLLLRLPQRVPLGWNGRGLKVASGPGGKEVHAVAAALPLGYTRLALPAYKALPGAPPLPLYGYTAVAWGENGFMVAAARTDHLETWAPEAHAQGAVRAGIELRRREFGPSALLDQLERCAIEYGCFTAQNVFLRQGEAALPVSPACNARCLGCISEQDPQAGIACAQERVATVPALQDLVRIAVAHLEHAPAAIVSFGQGCEGEPLLAAPLVEKAISEIRTRTGRGIIHCNTNASLPKALERLIAAGLQSVRISCNSVRPETYAAYYRPRGYTFADVRAGMQLAAQRGLAVSLNLLTHPGVTDDMAEMDAMEALLREIPISMVQTRTLNVDPDVYFAAVGRPGARPHGMRRWLEWMQREFPQVRIGNFTRGFG